MRTPAPLFFFDYLDPLSYLVDRELEALAADGLGPGTGLRRIPLELRPPPAPLVDQEGEDWRARWAAAAALAEAGGVTLAEPPLVPWTRKAHEFVLHAAEKGAGEAAHRKVFDAVFVRGSDVGRVDVLVGLARELGLDAMEAKAVLDVDRHTAAVAGLRVLAEDSGVGEPPALVHGGRALRGFHNRGALRTFLLR